MEVVVEVAAERRVPGKRPPALGLVALDLVDRRARHDRERRVTRRQMLAESVGHLVRRGRAARAAVVPARVEHEVLHDQLASSFEQVKERGPSGRAFEHVVLVDADHG